MNTDRESGASRSF
uniref:Uncharacterized protein n=1 Tax=Anguilla anguilla TaxID=7936 RepID=A0A0E9TG69_ANGAN